MAVRTWIEVERTYELAPSAAAPDLVGVAGVVEVRQLEDEHLDATYYDTADLRLARARTTLRRRRGGRDAGWHLKLPVSRDTREEVTLPFGRSATVPAELAALVRSRTRAAPLLPVVRLRSQRVVRQLLDGDGRVLAELADDRVTGEVLGKPRQTTVWRELEVELVAGDEALLDALGSQLQSAGAIVAARPSKLARTLGSRLPDTVAAPLPRRPTAADAVLRHLREQVTELTARDPSARRDLPDAVHRMRVASRRLRSALQTYGPLLDPVTTDPLRAELKQLAAVLGGARDAEVLRDHLTAEVAGLPPELVLGPVAQRITDELGRQHREAHTRLVEELNGPRYLALLDALDQLLTDPPWTGRAQRPAGQELRRLVRRTVDRLEQAADAADGAPIGQQRDDLLHEVRKTAKQVRYAAESTIEVLGKPAAAFAGMVERVQEVLGEFQDSIEIGERLRELAVHAHLAGENAFTFGLLQGLEQGRAARAQAAYPQTWKAVSRKRARRWLR